MAASGSGKISSQIYDGLRYGDKLPDFSAKDVTNKIVTNATLRGKANVIIFFRPDMPQNRDRLTFASILTKKYDPTKLEVVGISIGDVGWLIKRGFHPDHVIILNDTSYSLGKKFKTRQCCGATIIVDKEGVVQFASHSAVSNDYLGQLIPAMIK